MPQSYSFHDIARLPLPGDNVAIATRRLNAGSEIVYNDARLLIDHTVMEGHRFAVQPIAPGDRLLSWNLPFGVATRAIQPGNYLCNPAMLEALSVRQLDFPLPTTPNFADRITPYILDEATFQPAPPVILHEQTRTFMGYRRSPVRGVGTRNMIVLLGTSSRTGSYVKQLAARLKLVVNDMGKSYANLDGIVAAAHTEGATPDPNNRDLLLRTLAGLMVNPNVGAVLAVDYGLEPINNAMLQEYLVANGYPLDDLPHAFLSLSGGFQANLAQGEEIVRGWLDQVNATPRTPQSLAHLRIALQCGGSDAFSGVSGNPLLGWVAHEVVRYGGAANLCETDELIGAEPYVLQKVRDAATAQTFLHMVERFKEYAERHGASAEGNPSGGNKYRGLYNITLKSIGAGMKRDPRTRLDYCIEYAERMSQPGYYFMDSPGNDLEGIAGQMAAGCNMIFFVTGNGSVTNFPYVPTIKIVTTSKRYDLLHNEMDVNAGAYLDGTPMDDLGQQKLELTVAIASGQPSAGERAGHAQLQIWRNWPLQDATRLPELLNPAKPDGRPIPIQPATSMSNVRFRMVQQHGISAADQVGLILPTSLCSGQVAGLIAARLNKQKLGREQGISRFVALAHTEGCGASGGGEALYARTMLGYASHPSVREVFLLEHGCERTHNDFMRHAMQEIGMDASRLGWASIQLDGGIEAVQRKAESWFSQRLVDSAPSITAEVGLEALRIGLLSAGPVNGAAADQLARLTKLIVAAGGSVVVPENTGLLSAPAYRQAVLTQATVLPSLAYGEHARVAGFHSMEAASEHWVETLTGLAATGVELIIGLVNDLPMQTHPLVPVLQVTTNAALYTQSGDLDLLLSGDSAEWPEELLQLIKQVIEHQYAPKLYSLGNIDFQMSRGLLGITL